MVLSITLMCFSLSHTAFAFEVGSQAIDLDVGSTFVTKYLFRGIDTFDDEPGIQPYATLTIHPFDINISGGFWGAYALTSGRESLDEQDYWFSMDKDFSIFNAGWGYTYYDFFNASSDGDINEFQFFGSISEIPLPEGTDLPVIGDKIPVSLGFMAAYAFGNKSEDEGGIDNGWYFEPTVGIEIPIPGSEKLPFQEDGLTVTYDNAFGFYDGSIGTGSGFHHWTQSVGTSIALPLNLSLSPALSYQLSNHAGVNSEDEFYFTLDLSLSF